MVTQDSRSQVPLDDLSRSLLFPGRPFFAARNLPERYRCGTEPFSCSVKRLYPLVSRAWNAWHNRDFEKVTIMLAAYKVSRCVFLAFAVFASLAVYGLPRLSNPFIHMIQSMRQLQIIHIELGECNVHSRIVTIFQDH
jgi:hypothetical protein